MATLSSTAPILSTPDDHILSETTTDVPTQVRGPVSDTELAYRYEIDRTAADLISGSWTCIALQFSDTLLADAPRVVELLRGELAKTPPSSKPAVKDDNSELETSMHELSVSSNKPQPQPPPPSTAARRLYILGDTSYGACCVDEVAAEHISAEVMIHYGRACLSPTARLPVIHVFTKQHLDHGAVVQAFKETYADQEARIVLMADVMYSSHVNELSTRLREVEGYSKLFTPEILHDPSSPLPNRTIPEDVKMNPELLKDYSLFHISDPPTALLLTLSSRVAETTIFPTSSASGSITTRPIKASTSSLLRRRYALLTSLTTEPIFGILINTLSVSSYLSAANNIRDQLAAAGKKSYTFVVGKINAAKVANFAEVGGWVVVGCWESSLVEGDGFWKPVITPFELSLVLRGDKGRIWTGEWRGDFGAWINGQQNEHATQRDGPEENTEDSEEESEPPEFDLRTGRYVSHSRPMASESRRKRLENGTASTSLVKRMKGDLAVIGNEVSPGAEFLQTQRTWRGLGSDIQIEYDDDGHEKGTLVEEGRKGIARGYANEQ